MNSVNCVRDVRVRSALEELRAILGHASTGSPPPALAAIRLYSRTLREELWIAWDDAIAEELVREFPRVAVFTLDELERLCRRPLELIRVIADVRAVFPDAKLR